MGIFQGGIAGMLEGVGAGEKNFKRDIHRYGDRGRDVYNYGSGLTEEGLGGLRDLDAQYTDKLKDPLGRTRGIFARARGQVADDSVRGQRSFLARTKQRALQMGGTMSPEAVAALDQENQAALSEEQFKAQGDISNQEAALELTETNKFLDRIEGIRRTVLGVGVDQKKMGMDAIYASLGLRFSRNKAIADNVASYFGARAGGNNGQFFGNSSGGGSSSGGGFGM